MRAVLRDHAGNPVRLADRCKTCSGEAIRAADASPPGPARERATALIDALNKDGGGHVVHGALQAAMIAEANASDAARTPPRTSPVTPAERACATVLRTWLEWHETPPEPRGDAYEAMLNLGDWLADSGIVEGESLALTPAGRDLLARVEAAAPDPTAAIVAFLRAEETKFRKAASFTPSTEARMRCESSASALATVGAYIARGDHLAPIAAPPAKEPR